MSWMSGDVTSFGEPPATEATDAPFDKEQDSDGYVNDVSAETARFKVGLADRGVLEATGAVTRSLPLGMGT